MFQNEYVLLLNGYTRIVVRDKTASVNEELIGFPIYPASVNNSSKAELRGNYKTDAA